MMLRELEQRLKKREALTSRLLKNYRQTMEPSDDSLRRNFSNSRNKPWKEDPVYEKIRKIKKTEKRKLNARKAMPHEYDFLERWVTKSREQVISRTMPESKYNAILNSTHNDIVEVALKH